MAEPQAPSMGHAPPTRPLALGAARAPPLGAPSRATLARVARVLTGSERTSARLVRRACREGTNRRGEPRELERCFARLCADPALLASEADPFAPRALRERWRRLASLAPALRLPYALHRVGGLDAAVIGRIRSLTAAEAGSLVLRAERFLERRVHARVLVLGADPLALLALRRALEAIGHQAVTTRLDRGALIARMLQVRPELLVLHEVGSPAANATLESLADRLELPLLTLGVGASGSRRGFGGARPLQPGSVVDLRRACLRALIGSD